MTLLLLCGWSVAAHAQSNDFRTANQLMQQQKYEEALPILQDLHEQNPSTYTFYERLADCLINLKKYDEAIRISKNQLERNAAHARTQIKLAEIYHTKGDIEQAKTTWREIIDSDPQQIQNYHNVAASMNSRREYADAVELYERARERFGNPQLFTSELANTFMQAGQFKKAVNEYFKVIKESPQQMGFVQQRFLRMRDDELFNTAALELEDFLMETDQDHEAYSQLYQLLSWLLMETEEYRRAFVFARRYESQTAQTNYTLFSLGNHLRSARQYELAVDAFSYYIDEETNLRSRAMEEKANTYTQWARYLKQHSIESPRRQKELFEEAYGLNETLLESSPNYNRKGRVITSQIDLSLDQFKDIDKAERWYQKMDEELSENDQNKAYQLYAEGRIALFKNNYTRARQSLTRADRATDESSLSEQIRYYLTLSDFFSGDYEFAEIQLKSLERRNTSYFANNAIQLRMWIKNGMRIDSTGSDLNQLSDGLNLVYRGEYEQAIEHFRTVLDSPTHPFADDIAVELAKQLPFEYQPAILEMLEVQVTENISSPLRERIMWERAVISERLMIPEQSDEEISQTVEERIDQHAFSDSDIEEMFEAILLEFPNGFYARYARQKLQQQPIDRTS